MMLQGSKHKARENLRWLPKLHTGTHHLLANFCPSVIEVACKPQW